jgi:hypothetical protein
MIDYFGFTGVVRANPCIGSEGELRAIGQTRLLPFGAVPRSGLAVEARVAHPWATWLHGSLFH